MENNTGTRKLIGYHGYLNRRTKLLKWESRHINGKDCFFTETFLDKRLNTGDVTSHVRFKKISTSP